MKCFVLLAVLAAFVAICQGREVEDSHISIYGPPQAPEAATVSVYKQIVTNIAEKITDPIRKFFGFGDFKEKTTQKAIPTTKGWKLVTKQSTEATSTSTHSTEGATTENINNITVHEWTTAQGNENIEENSTKELTWKNFSSNETDTINSTTSSSDPKSKQKYNLEVARDIEEILPEKVNETKVKPEKYISSTTTESDAKDAINEISDDDFFMDFDPEQEKRQESGLVYFLEWAGSLFQLAWGAISSVFKPKPK